MLPKKNFETENQASKAQTLTKIIKKTCSESQTPLNPIVNFWSIFDPGTLFPILVFALWTIWSRQSIDLDLSSPEHFFWLNSGSDSVPNGKFCIFQFATLSVSNKIL